MIIWNVERPDNNRNVWIAYKDHGGKLCHSVGYLDHGGSEKWFILNNGDYHDGGYGQEYPIEGDILAWTELPHWDYK